MIVESTIEVMKDKYGSSLAKTGLTINSDNIQPQAVQFIAAGLITSALKRAKIEPEIAPLYQNP